MRWNRCRRGAASNGGYRPSSKAERTQRIAPRKPTAGAGSDIDVIVVAPTERPFVDRFRDYLPAIVDAGVGVDLLVYTPAEFARMKAEERPFLVDALADARQIHAGRDGRS